MTGAPSTAGPSEPVLLTCLGIVKSFGAVRALRGANLSVQTASIHGLVGHNGAGKSTLVRTIVGRTAPDAGEVRFDGAVLDPGDPRAAIARGIQAVPQELAILPGMSVADNVSVGDEPNRHGFVRWGQMRSRAEETLARLGMDIAADARVDELRPSQQRMVMIASAVSRKCRFLILDEPTASLGTDEAAPLLDVIESLPGAGITVLYISHRLDEVARLCDRVTVMRDGNSLETVERGGYTARSLVTQMVDEMPARPTTERRVASDNWAVRMVGVRSETLRGVNAEFRAGAVTGVTGLIGSGADELLEVVAGAARPTAGTVEIQGQPVKLKSPADGLAHGVGYVPGTRARAAMTTLTIRENVLASCQSKVARFGFLFGSREREHAAQLVERHGLADRVDRPLSELSGGNQQKVLISRLLAADARVLVVDDPTAGVDVRARAELHALIREAASNGLAVVVRSSEPEELLDLADEVLVLAGGRVSRIFSAPDLDLSDLLEASATSGGLAEPLPVPSST